MWASFVVIRERMGCLIDQTQKLRTFLVMRCVSYAAAVAVRGIGNRTASMR